MLRYLPWLLKFLGTAFLLQLVWETLHGAAYVESAGPILWRARHCLPMAAVDALWTLALYLALVLGVTVARPRHFRLVLFAGTAFLGALTATVIELDALASGRWSYNQSMPVIPVLHVGLWPVLQMAVVPVIVAALAPIRVPAVSAGR